MNKTCTHCRKYLPLSSFNKKHDTKDGFQTICRECNKARSKRYYKENREKHLKVVYQARKGYVQRNRNLLLEVKLHYGCALCDEAAPCCLDFHHMDDDKDENIACLIGGGASVQTILKEIGKCACLCSNCHRKVHAGLLTVGEEHRCRPEEIPNGSRHLRVLRS